MFERADWTFPYPSQRMPVLARNVVATSQPLAAQAGLRMLAAGGNAVDAALAAAIALTVVEPTSNGIGSDAFALIWRDGALHGLNGSGRSPRALHADQFANLQAMPTHGWPSVTVPGAVSAWVALHERFGSLAFEQLFAPAIEYAAEGFLVSPQTAHAWERSMQTLGTFDAWRETFAPTGSAPKAGELFRCPDQASTLSSIASSRGRAFYRGELAERIAAAAKAEGGVMSLADLAEHEAQWVQPISTDFCGATLHEIPPNGQGLAALIALGILEQLEVTAHPVDSAASLHMQIEAMKLGFADARQFVADPDAMDVTAGQLLDTDYLKSRAALFDPRRASRVEHGRPRPGGTVYLAAADADGTMVSFIQSNYMGFGSGVVIPGTGIAMQNRGANFSLTPGHPNQVAGFKRPYHTFIPGFVTRSGRPLMAMGVMGGFMQPQGHVQVMVRMAGFNQNPQAALDAPRWRVDEAMAVSIEPGFNDDVYGKLQSLGHEVTQAESRTVAHGGGQIVARGADGYCAASDLRRDGQAVGF